MNPALGNPATVGRGAPRDEGAMKVVCDSVCAIVFRIRRGHLEYLVLQRTKERGGFWQPVTGTVRKQELAEDVARREVNEETGLPVKRLLPLQTVHTFHKPGRPAVHLEPCVAVEVEAGDEDLRLSREHDRGRWVGLEAAQALIPHRGVRSAMCELEGLLAPELSDASRA